jgi:hypothetical protein
VSVLSHVDLRSRYVFFSYVICFSPLLCNFVPLYVISWLIRFSSFRPYLGLLVLGVF